MMPTEPDPVDTRVPSGPVPVPNPEYRWYHKTLAVLFITFCLEVGFFLVIFPWTDSWDNNYFAALGGQVSRIWDNLFVRGAITGLGVVDLYISFGEVFRLRRFAKRW